MRRFVLTGAPGAGKTTIVNALRDRGFAIIGEAATDVISTRLAAGVAEPWTETGFLDRITALQRRRQLEATAPVQVFDRSPVCTLALAVYSGQPVPRALREELRRSADLYHRRVLFVGLLGFVTPTAARRIGLEDARRFERIHEEVYRDQGYEVVDVPPGAVDARLALVMKHLRAWT